MSQWAGGVLTAAGRVLQAKVETGTTLTFTKIKLGDGTESMSAVDSLVDLVSPKAILGISSVTSEDDVATITGVMSATQLTAGFYCREWGLFAQDPDVGEILYMITIDAQPEWLPASTEAAQVSATYAMNIAVANATNIEVNIDPAGLVDIDMFNEIMGVAKRSKVYRVGDLASMPGLPAEHYLRCITAGTTGANTPVLPAGIKDGYKITDGTVMWQVTKAMSAAELGYRQPSTTYKVGNFAYHASLPTGWYLECTTAGTTSASNITPPTTIGGTVTDGTVVWIVKRPVMSASKVEDFDIFQRNTDLKLKDLDERIKAAGENGSTTINDSVVPTADSCTINTALDGIANRIKAITGKSGWKDTPAINLNNASLKALASVTGSANAIPLYDSASTMSALKLSNIGKSILTATDGDAARSLIGAAGTATATKSTNGLLSAADKTKLDNVPSTYIKNLSISGTKITVTKGDNTTSTLTTQDNNTTYSNFVKSGENAAAGLVPKPSTTPGSSKYLCENGTWAVPPDNNTTYSNFVKSGENAHNGLVPKPPTTAGTTHYLREDGTWTVPPNTTYSNMTAATSSAAGKAGLVPAPAAGKQGQYLRGDGTWQTPTNTTYSDFVKSGENAHNGLVPKPSTTAGTTHYLREDGTWSVPPDTTRAVSLKGTRKATNGDWTITGLTVNYPLYIIHRIGDKDDGNGGANIQIKSGATTAWAKGYYTLGTPTTNVLVLIPTATSIVANVNNAADDGDIFYAYQ